MKKIAVGSLVGGIIIFFWQFLSWALLDLHRPMQEHTPKQTEILDYLGQNLEEGFYYLPTLPKGAAHEEYETLMKSSEGKPWAQIYYHKSLNTAMGMNMVRGLLADIIAVALLCWVLLKMGNPSFQTIVISSVGVGLISFLTAVYTIHIWYEIKVFQDLVDAILQWGVTGLWLGWWLRK
ncbi:hypothetical protein GVN16_06545 [Emticicia sp. CRIBPO]|jgi:hypothetical protein|uniref:hypothetical protein n=1 Tax=Emticicia sp. CRIBPO TaxID=2683258 RepID=UPI001412196F|nr:hypothetical protein [Emticicia sp. CRIBPO]NBA85413.1 hypothetical protein [Emticicia sp. CRIBPO]